MGEYPLAIGRVPIGRRLAPAVRRGLKSRPLGWLVLFGAAVLAGAPPVYAGCLAALPWILMRP